MVLHVPHMMVGFYYRNLSLSLTRESQNSNCFLGKLASCLPDEAANNFCDEPYVHRYGEEQKLADNEVWQANRQFVK